LVDFIVQFQFEKSVYDNIFSISRSGDIFRILLKKYISPGRAGPTKIQARPAQSFSLKGPPGPSKNLFGPGRAARFEA
jgi:hypothetical protein